CLPPSGSAFKVGTTTVTCTATDSCGNTGQCSFTVRVNDTQPPVITCPANISTFENPFGSGGATVNYTPPTATDNCTASVVCAPASGSIFPTGATTVTCTATDPSNNTARCQFTVTVMSFDVCVQ